MASANLHAAFQLQLADFDLSPRFELGPELAVLFGPSGAGKTLTLRVLAGLVRPDSGYIHLNGQTLFDSSQEVDLPPQERRIGYVPQHYALFPNRSLEENIAFGLHELPRSERDARVSEFLSLMRLEELAERRPAELSGGQQQRTALARALARRPNLLLMDEPFAAVEEDMRAHLREGLHKIQKEFEIPVLLVTHSRAEAYTLAERLIVIDRGVIEQSGARDQVFRTPSSPEVARMMGMTNILRGLVAEERPGTLVVNWAGTDLAVTRAGQQSYKGPLLLGVRPEEIRFLKNGDQPAPNQLQGRVERDEPQGADHLLRVEVEQEALEIRVPHPSFVALDLAVGQERTLTIHPDNFHIIPEGK